RPDAPLYAPLVLLAGWRGGAKELWRRAFGWSLCFGLGFSALWWAHAAYYGTWMPNPLLSKVIGIPNKEELGLAYLRDFALDAWPLLAALAASLLLIAARPGERRRDSVPLAL